MVAGVSLFFVVFGVSLFCVLLVISVVVLVVDIGCCMQVPWHLSVVDRINKLIQDTNICCKFQKNSNCHYFYKTSERRLLHKDALFDSIFAGLFMFAFVLQGCTRTKYCAKVHDRSSQLSISRCFMAPYIKYTFAGNDAPTR